MSRPRQSLPGQTIHVIRNTSERRFFLAPSREMEKIHRYAYALAIEESGQVPHAECMMTTHNHAQNTDPNGKRSKFTETLHGFIGKFGNGLLNRKGHFWDNERTTEIVLLHDPELPPIEEELLEELKIDDILQRVATERDLDVYQIVACYIWMNPVSANLIDRIGQYPGLTVLPDDWGETIEVARPPGVSDAYPPFATYRPEPPPGKWSEMPLADAIADAKELIAHLEDLYRAKRHRDGKRVLGPKALREQNPFGRPRPSQKSVRRRKRRSPTPRFAGHQKLVDKANTAYAVYCHNHCRAGRRLRNGHPNPLFPAGAVGMQRIAGVKCRPRPLAAENPMP